MYGLRTSMGCVPHGPTDEVFFQQFSVAGPMARNIPDLAMLLSVQAGFDARLPLTRRSEGPKTGAGRWSGTFAAHASAGWVTWAVTCRRSQGCWTPAARLWAISKPLAARWRR